MAIETVDKEVENKARYEKKANQNMKKQSIQYDDLLSSAGELGRYQILLFFATCPFYTFGVLVYYSQLFMTEVSPNHWCWIPELANLTDLERRDLGVPKDESKQFGYSQCDMYAVNWSEVLATGQKPDKTWDIEPCRYGWEFNKTEIPYPTIASDLGWVCEKNSYQANAQAIFFVGSVFGGFIIGWVSDHFGRLPAAIVSNLIGCIGGVISTFARNFLEFSAARFFMGIAYDNCMIMAYLIVLEYVAPKYRTVLANLAAAIFYSLAVTTIPWIFLLCGHWKTISLVSSLPLALALLSPFILPESPRWLLSKGRVDEALNKLLVIGRINKKEIPPSMINQFRESMSEDSSSFVIKEEESSGFLEIFKRSLLAKIFILVCIEYICCNLVLDGLVRSIGQLEFDFFMSFTVISFTELPSIIIVAFTMDLMGRKWMTIVSMTVSCLFCFLTVFGSGVQTIISAIIARFAVNMAYNTCSQWAAEVLPTSVRGSGTSVVHICGYIATVISPYVVYLKAYVYWLPLVIIGCAAGIGALAAIGLPETARKDMPHTFDDAEKLARNQKLWTMPCMEKKISKEENNLP